MNLNVAKAQMIDALKQLNMRWLRISEGWDDDARRRFEAEFIEPLEGKVRAALQGVDHVNDLIARARRDCGDDE